MSHEDKKSWAWRTSGNLFVQTYKDAPLMLRSHFEALQKKSTDLMLAQDPTKGEEGANLGKLIALLSALPISDAYWMPVEDFDWDNKLVDIKQWTDDHHLKQLARREQDYGITYPSRRVVSREFYLKGLFPARAQAVKKDTSWIRVPTAAECQAHWSLLGELAQGAPKFNQALNAVGFPPLDAGFVKKAGQLGKITKDWVAEEVTPETRAAQKEGFAVWNSRAQGFLGERGGQKTYGGLAGAVFFETAEGAKKSSRARGVSDGFVVKVGFSMEGLEALSEKSDAKGLGAGFANAEASRLEEALRQANADWALKRIAELEGSADESTKPKAPKGRL